MPSFAFALFAISSMSTGSLAHPQMVLKSIVSTGKWMEPTSSDHRAPCPGLNTLANHGFINRNGTDIPLPQIRAGLKDVYGIATDFQDVLINSFGRNGNLDANGRVDLNFLRKHDPQNEHDASLVHDDTAFGPNWVTNQTLVRRLMSYSSDGGKSVSLEDVARYRVDREKESASQNPSFSFAPSNRQAALLEAAALIGAIGDSERVPIERARVFLGENRLVDSYEPNPKGPATSKVIFALAKSIQDAMDRISKQ